MWPRIGTLIVKELLAVWRDPRSRTILMVPPILQLLVFSFAATQEVKHVRIGVLNRDWGTYSRDFVARLEGSQNFDEIEFLADESEIARMIDTRRVIMVVHIQPDFSRRVATGEPATVQLILDGRRSNAAQIVAGYTTEIASRYALELDLPKPAPVPPSVVVPRIWFNPNQITVWNTVPALVAVLTTLEALVITALSVARERELGTFEQLLVSPLSPREIIIGKTIPALAISILVATGMVLLGVFAMGVPFEGSVVLLYASMLVYLLSVIGVGLFISSLAKTQQQAMLGTFVFMVPAMLLSGFASPIENMPDWLQTVTLLNPIRYYIVIIKGVFLKDLPALIVFQNLLPMVIIGVVALATATWLFRHRME